MTAIFRDRPEAACALAARLADAHLPPPMVVLALPRGGAPIGTIIARRLQAPLDLLLVRKIGAPAHRELAVAAVAEAPEGEVVVDQETLAMTGAGLILVEGNHEKYTQTAARKFSLLRSHAFGGGGFH